MGWQEVCGSLSGGLGRKLWINRKKRANLARQIVAHRLMSHDETTQLLRAELDKIYGLISYELGSPLNSLHTLAEFALADGQHAYPGLAQTIGHLYRQIEALQTRLGNLIYWADLQVKNYHLRLEPLDLGQLLLAQQARWQPMAAVKGIHWGPPAVVPAPVRADPKMLAWVLDNLLSNAVKFCRPGDRITLSVSAAAGQAECRVADTGPGLGPAKLAAVFKPSRRNAGRGTANEAGLGLGLVVAQALLQLQGSHLSLASQPGAGTQAHFILPLH
jgi:signal transduction histidine kinase